MSLQDTVYDLRFELEEYIQIAAGGGPKPTDSHKTMKKYHEIVKRLWEYEEKRDQLEKVCSIINDFGVAINNIKALYPPDNQDNDQYSGLDIGDTCSACGQEWTGTL